MYVVQSPVNPIYTFHQEIFAFALHAALPTLYVSYLLLYIWHIYIITMMQAVKWMASLRISILISVLFVRKFIEMNYSKPKTNNYFIKKKHIVTHCDVLVVVNCYPADIFSEISVRVIPTLLFKWPHLKSLFLLCPKSFLAYLYNFSTKSLTFSL